MFPSPDKSTRFVLALVGVIGAALLWNAEGRASSMALRGQPPFAFGASYVEEPSVGRPIRLRITCTGFYDASASSQVSIDVPSGLEVVEGETNRVLSPLSDDGWFLTLRPTRQGKFRIHGTMRTTCATHVDEAEFQLSIQVLGNRTTGELSRPLRLERVEGGQRFRYGYDYLVPIPGAQMVTQGAIEAEGGKPQILESRSGQCSECRLPAPVTVLVRVLVDERGRVSDSEYVGPDRDLSPAIIEAAKAAARNWRFRPAHAAGITTPDRTVVEVPVQ